MESSRADAKTGSLMVELKNYLSTPENPVSSAEFRAFWMSCSREEKDEFALQAQKDLERDG